MLEDLDRAATAIGSDPTLVQGAGGNLSGKDGDTVWVKASGTRLGEAAERPVFVGVDATRAAAEVLHVEDLRHVVTQLADERASRPSIETALHVLLPQTFVFHVHSVGAVAAASRADGATAPLVLAGPVPTRWVPYAKPGIALAHAVLAAQADIGDVPEAVFLLGNHGLITAAPSADRALALIGEVEAGLRPARGLPQLPTSGDVLAPAGSVDPRGAAFLQAGVLTPDEAVFLGAVPFSAEGGRGTVEVAADGSLVARRELSADAQEIARSFVHVAACADHSRPARYLTDDEVAELVDWEAEKWRQGMQR